MKVRMRTSIAGRTFSYSSGSVVDLPETQAQRWISAGIAEPVRATRETATQTYETTAAVEPKHVGGGWYELPSGETVRGREEAMKRMNQ